MDMRTRSAARRAESSTRDSLRSARMLFLEKVKDRGVEEDCVKLYMNEKHTKFSEIEQ
jgi:hypothetical protein